jgi:Protein of unknown function (DUF1236)
LRTKAVLVVACSMACASGVAAQPAEKGSLTSEQLDVIRRHIVRENRPSITAPAELAPAVGAKMPDNVELFWMPPGAGLNRYRYAVVNRRALVLDYQDRRVIEILERLPERR